MQIGMQRDKTKPGLKKKKKKEINPQALQTWSKILSPLRDQSPKAVAQHCPIRTSQGQILFLTGTHIPYQKNQQLGHNYFFLLQQKFASY